MEKVRVSAGLFEELVLGVKEPEALEVPQILILCESVAKLEDEEQGLTSEVNDEKKVDVMQVLTVIEGDALILSVDVKVVKTENDCVVVRVLV